MMALLLACLVAAAQPSLADEPAPKASGTPSKTHGDSNPLLNYNIDQLMNLDLVQVTVPGAHWHQEGDFMVGLQWMHQRFNGYLIGTRRISDEDVTKLTGLADNANMTMDMQMIMLMYGINNKITLNAMIPITQMSMQFYNPGGGGFVENSSGLGDIYLSVITPIYQSGVHRLQIEPGITIPTGSINNMTVVPPAMPGMPAGMSLVEYKMQPGTGTVAFAPKLTYLAQTDKVAWGAQLSTELQLGQNSHHYQASNTGELTAWVAPTVSEHFSPSLRLALDTWSNIRGADPGLTPAFDPETVPGWQGGTRLEALFGLNWSLGTDQSGHGHYFSLEFGLPWWQSLRGPQMKEGYQISGAWQWTFK
jgi:hypothetical protein